MPRGSGVFSGGERLPRWRAGLAAVALAAACAFPAAAAEFRIVVERTLEEADVTTHEIRSGDVVLGISDLGGGYINKLYIPGIGDLLGPHAARFGRGGQLTIRDHLHGGRYNPTQAGFTDRAGTQVVIQQPAPGRLYMAPRPVALWNGDSKYDFTEWENLAADPYRHDGGNTDSDGIDESNLPGKQATEITSEFDLTVTYEDVRDGDRVRIPAFRFGFEFRFIRPPGHALSQFRRGTPVYDPSVEIDDISNLYPAGVHPSTEGSLTGVVLSSTLRGDKAIWDPGVVYFVDPSGALVTEKPRRAFRRWFMQQNRFVMLPLVILSRSDNPDHGPAIGYYYPRNRINSHNVVGRAIHDGSLVYEDVRGTSATFVGSIARTPYMWLFGVRAQLKGLLSRLQTPPGVYEGIRGETYILVGTPNEILQAARAIHS